MHIQLTQQPHPHKPCEDLFGFSDGACWMLDGATQAHAPGNSPVGSRWLVQQANLWLHRHHDQLTDRTCTDWVRSLFGALADAFEQEAGVLPLQHRPMAALGVVRHDHATGQVHVVVFGDVTVARVPAAGADVKLFEVEGLTLLQACETPVLAEIRQGVGFDAPSVQAARRHMKAQQAEVLNAPGGLWVLRPQRQTEGLCCAAWTVAYQPDDRWVLMTDGATAAATHYGLRGSVQQLANDLSRDPQLLQGLAASIRAAETLDDTGARHPRTKQFDDLTAAVVQL